jgi:hypothetical protein
VIQCNPLLSPHRLVAQDEALSRLKPGFEFPWGHSQVTVASMVAVTF